MPSHRFTLPDRVPALIFLNGPAGSGKSAIAEHLVSLDRGFTIYHHASPLWAMLDQIVGADPSTGEPYDFNAPSVKVSFVPWSGKPCDPEAHPTFRDALVSLGAWTRDMFGPETFSRIAAAATNDLLASFDSVIFPAIRTPEDLSCLLDRASPQDYLLIRLFRPSCDWRGDLGGYLDPSKFSVPSIDIHNDGTLEDLFEKVLSALGVSLDD